MEFEDTLAQEPVDAREVHLMRSVEKVPLLRKTARLHIESGGVRIGRSMGHV